MKPDVSAPGVGILGAYSPIGSPSSNHDDTRSVKAGIAAYVKALHLDWSPAAIKSAIMTSARPMNGSNLKEQIGEYAYGSGQSIFGESSYCYGASDRSLVKHLNYPALAVKVRPKAPFSVGLNRTVTNVGLANSIYKATILPNPQINIIVAPEVLIFTSLNEKQSFVVTITGGQLQNGIVIASSLTWLDGTHSVQSPIILNVSS
ncbi:subtilisin-like protease SBT4.3 [Lotus japonicus]|uniref:subtilisin-like protease SBT4.3 n=1 Tax=Lotus japonicus TaxID=34305 RepID=UPI0025895DE7|nr:subtilisin-like protease SBT4.3 [Lotus japonicus]